MIPYVAIKIIKRLLAITFTALYSKQHFTVAYVTQFPNIQQIRNMIHIINGKITRYSEI